MMTIFMVSFSIKLVKVKSISGFGIVSIGYFYTIPGGSCYFFGKILGI